MLAWLQGPSLADLLEGGPDPSDPPDAEADWSLLNEVVAAIGALTEKLKREPDLAAHRGDTVRQTRCTGLQHSVPRADLAAGTQACRLAASQAWAERRRSRRATDERDEVAAIHSITSSARASRVGGTVSARISSPCIG